MSKRFFSLVLTTLVLISGQSLASNEKLTHFLEILYEKPSLNLKAYNKVYIDTLGVSDAKLVLPPWADQNTKKIKNWSLTEKDVQLLKDAYRNAMTTTISADDGFPIVTEYGNDVLVIDIAIQSLTPYAPKGDKVITKGTGELAIQLQLRDGGSGALLGIYEGTQAVGEEYQENNRLSATSNLNALFSTWANQSRKILDNAHNK
ncbi:MAG: hypothetical protein ACJAQS_001451 [Porticoccus sp.]|jgi:hypothetical protein